MSVSLPISRFSTCDLAALDALTFDNRTDTKYLFEAADIAGLINALSADYQLLVVNNEHNFRYQNTYFDSEDLEHYHAHHAGRGNRYKYRVRKYGDLGDSFFEIKHKSNKGITHKKRVQVHAFSNYPEIPTPFLQQNLEEQFPVKTLVNYQRLTFLNPVSMQKLTVDYNLQAINDTTKVQYPQLAIAEIKQLKGSGKSMAMRYFKSTHVQPIAFSKYCISLATLNPALKHNRFLPIFRQLHKISPITITTQS